MVRKEITVLCFWDMFGHINVDDNGDVMSDFIDLFPDASMTPWTYYEFKVPVNETKKSPLKEFKKEANTDKEDKKFTDRLIDRFKGITFENAKKLIQHSESPISFDELKRQGVRYDDYSPLGPDYINIYEILEKHPEFKQAYSVKYGIITINALFHNNRITATTKKGISIVYDEYGYLQTDGKRDSDLIDLFPNENMDLWTSIDEPKFMKAGETPVSLKKYINHRIGSKVFSPVCGYAKIDRCTEDNVIIKGDDNELYVFDYFGWYYGRDIRKIDYLPISRMVLLMPSDDSIVTWEEWSEKTNWRASKSEVFYYMTAELKVCQMMETYTYISDNLFKVRNYFKTSKEVENKILKVNKIFENESI